MFERYTEKARRVIFYARYEAGQQGASAIGPEHLLLGLLRADEHLSGKFLQPGEALEEVRRRGEKNAAPREGLSTSTELPLSPDAKKVLTYAMHESDGLSHRHIGTEHLLLALLRAEGTVAEDFLREKGLTRSRVIEELGAAGLLPASGVGGPAAGEGAAGLHGLSVSAHGMRVEHIGIATPQLDLALKFWRDALGLEVKHTEVVEEQGVRVAMLPAGEARIELLEPTHENSPVAKFLQKRGAGIHHIAVRVDDIRAALARLKEQGARLIDESPRVGAGGCLVAFVHPSSTGGVLFELVEHAAGEAAS